MKDDWKVSDTAENVFATKQNCQVKGIRDYNFIYCFPWTIHIEGGEYRCPPDVFKLPMQIPFSCPGYDHAAHHVHFDILAGQEIGMEAAHVGHYNFNSSIRNELIWFDALINKTRDFDKLRSTTEHSIIVEKNSGWFWFFIGIMSTCMVLLLYNAYLAYRKISRAQITARNYKHTRHDNTLTRSRSQLIEMQGRGQSLARAPGLSRNTAVKYSKELPLPKHYDDDELPDGMENYSNSQLEIMVPSLPSRNPKTEL